MSTDSTQPKRPTRFRLVWCGISILVRWFGGIIIFTPLVILCVVAESVAEKVQELASESLKHIYRGFNAIKLGTDGGDNLHLVEEAISERDELRGRLETARLFNEPLQAELVELQAWKAKLGKAANTLANPNKASRKELEAALAAVNDFNNQPMF